MEPGERTGRYRLGTESPIMDADGKSRISAADLAAAIVAEVETPQYRRARFTAAY